MNRQGKQYKKAIMHIFEQIAAIFMPVAGCITAAGIMKSVLLLFTMSGIMSETDTVYRFLFAAADGFFFFLPFFLAGAAAKKWNTDVYIAMMIPSAMLYPDLLEPLEQGNTLYLFAIKVPKAVYHASVIPVLLAVALLTFVERSCERILPEVVKGFLKPILCCIIVLPVTFLLLGPLGTWIGGFLSLVFMKVYGWNRIAAGVFMGAAIQPMVAVGAHWSIVPICMENIAGYGYDTILPLMGASVYGQSGAALAMGFLYEDPEKRRMARQAALSASLGVTEPAMFGVNLPAVRPMISVCIAGAFGGGLAGAAGSRCAAFAFPNLFTSVAYIGRGFAGFMASMALGFVLGFLLTMAQRKKIMGRIDKAAHDKEI